MVRYLLYVVAVFIVADHIYTHWGPEIINWTASKFLGKQVTVVEEAPYRESIIDKTVKTIKEKVKELRR